MTNPQATPTDVHVHVHLAVTGAFPLRVADVLFAAEGVVIPEYEYLTPLFGIARSGVRKASVAARERYREDGLAGLLDRAEHVYRLPYEEVTTVRLADSRISRPKLAVETAMGPPYAYRIHAPVDLDALSDALESLGEHHDFAVERRNAVGYDPVASVRRFLAGR